MCTRRKRKRNFLHKCAEHASKTGSKQREGEPMYSHHGCGRMYNWQKDATKGGSNLSAQNRIHKTLETCSDNSVHNHQKRAHTTALKQARRTKTSWKEISSGCTKTRHRFFSLKTPPAPSLCKLLYILDGTCPYENKAQFATGALANFELAKEESETKRGTT